MPLESIPPDVSRDVIFGGPSLSATTGLSGVTGFGSQNKVYTPPSDENLAMAKRLFVPAVGTCAGFRSSKYTLA